MPCRSNRVSLTHSTRGDLGIGTVVWRGEDQMLVRMDRDSELFGVDPIQADPVEWCRVCLEDFNRDDVDECRYCSTAMCPGCTEQHDRDDCEEIQERCIAASCAERNVRRRSA